MASLDRTSLTSCTNVALRFCLSYKVAQEFSYLGTRNKKKAFSNYKLKGTILAAVKYAIPSATNKEIENHIKNWLKRSPKNYAVQEQKKLNKQSDNDVEQGISRQAAILSQAQED